MSAQEMMPASSYWDRDGFCGHEVVGVVVESKSDKFAVGDEVNTQAAPIIM